jgi:uncharacterized protein
MQFKKAVNFILDKLEKELPKQLSYHNTDHIRDVYSAAKQIGQKEGISANEMKLLLTAAAYHDSGFIKYRDGHEEESCHIAKKILPVYGYSPREIKRIQGMIMATSIPQLPQNHLEEILADADLDYLGRDDFFTNGNKLFDEFLTAGIVNDVDDWNRLQVRFMENHHYFTQTSVNLRQAKKEQHLKQVKAKLNA